MISTEIKKLSSCKKELNITMDKDDLGPIREKQTKRLQKEVRFPGFRKGKAPLNLIKRNYADAIEAYTLEAALDEALKHSAIENNIQLVGTPEAKKVDFNENGDLVSVIEVETIPEIELKKYKRLVLTKDKYIITDKFVDDAIGRLLKEKALVISVDGPVEKGHIVLLDMQELDDKGNKIAGKIYNDISVQIGDGKFDPELEEQLIGLNNDEEREIYKVYPSDFPQKEYAEKKESYKIKIKNIQKEELPELDDDFVKELGGDLETVEDLKEKTRERLEHEYKIEAENRFASDLAQQLLEENPFEIPNTLVENYLDHVVENVRKRDPKIKEEVIRQHYQAEAIFNIKWEYLKIQIAKKEKIEVNDDDVNKFLDELKDDKLREFYKANATLLERAKEDIFNKKLHDFLVKNSKIKTNEIKLD